MTTATHPTPTDTSFDWPLAYQAESLVRDFISAFLRKNSAAETLAKEMSAKTGTDFLEWVDHFTLAPEHEEELRDAGFIDEPVRAEAGQKVLYHPRAMLPRVLLHPGGSLNSVPVKVAIRPESVVDFAARQQLSGEIRGSFGDRLREVVISAEQGHTFTAIERLAYRDFVKSENVPGFAAEVIAVRELWRTRKRDFPTDDEGVRRAFALQQEAIRRVGADVACELFFSEERAYWELKNRAGRIQKRRQDLLGLGWGNHDHHTFRSSRYLFPYLMGFLESFGFKKRERYYAGAEAGWGAQILEHAVTGITVFADVDLMPEETEIDFSSQRLQDAPVLRTVGLWCALHGDSLLQAGMHHLEARFEFENLRAQLAEEGINTMNPFSNFDFLKQAFTQGERWQVDPKRVELLLELDFITQEQAKKFLEEGAIGSHLENLQRRGGFKGFNQKSVSVIIEATDPRAVTAR
ncbi:MAG: hypothetical protein JOZ31_10835 [Verrucomicrobia bacterium]|nr:hypothetical protein [Verrucomicrobiota bacterium]MBV8485476.1 hypothetical protein [Verrucomicrobiota bacterium]